MFNRQAVRYYNLFLFLATSTNAIANNGQLDVEDVQSLFYQIIALLGLSLMVYLYINFRNNNKKQSTRKAHININHEAQTIAGNLQQMIELIPYPACISNEKQKVIYCNSLYKQLVKHQKITESHHWDKQLKLNSQQLQLDSSGDVIAQSEDTRYYKIAIRPVQVSDVSIQLFTVIIEEISHQYISEQKQHQLTASIANVQLPILLLNQDNTITDFNHSAIHLLKTDSQALQQKALTDIIIEDEHAAISQLLNRDFSHKSPFVFHLLTPNNTTQPVEVFKIELLNHGKPNNLLILIDISERVQMQNEVKKATQRAEESDRLKSSFLANMSHEVRTPLNSIMGFTELMCDDQLTGTERKEFHNIVKTSSNELLRLLNDIMEFSKIESGLISLDLKSTYAHEIVNELSEYAAPLVANNANLQFRVQEPIGFDTPAIITDKERVKQTLRHLIDNALKFTYSGTVTLSYQYRKDNSVEFIVSDTGIGIPKHKIPNIFHKFRQANDENSRDFGGAGLGLSICKHLANALGGFLWVTSVEKVGSEFHFVIPADGHSAQDSKTANTILFYSNKPQDAPVTIEDTKVLCLFQFQALLNVPLAHTSPVILIDANLKSEEMNLLLTIPQVRKASLIKVGQYESEIIYSPAEGETGRLLTDKQKLKKYISKCIERI
ncbi:PAS domain-containing protein [Carboxylicivirga sediminis]|uniref:histidine kinase n=1 Tax=Carboxylicivirga sediminis TaxID=2006564 RepID=A0A941IZT8_9BACT|nr:ATP-binding protein [Carboxylicivirga sediminis]MBR8537688.1 PAS domain-containing protein [Carboxylicivirga sediminis]